MHAWMGGTRRKLQAERGTVSALQRRYFAHRRANPANNERKEQANRIKKRVQSHRGNTQETMGFFMQLNGTGGMVVGSRDLVGLQPTDDVVAEVSMHQRSHRTHRGRDQNICERHAVIWPTGDAVPGRRKHSRSEESDLPYSGKKKKRTEGEEKETKSPSVSSFAQDLRTAVESDSVEEPVEDFVNAPSTEIRLYENDKDKTAFFREHRVINSSFFNQKGVPSGVNFRNGMPDTPVAQRIMGKNGKLRGYETSAAVSENPPVSTSHRRVERSRFWNIPPAVRSEPDGNCAGPSSLLPGINGRGSSPPVSFSNQVESFSSACETQEMNLVPSSEDSGNASRNYLSLGHRVGARTAPEKKNTLNQIAKQNSQESLRNTSLPQSPEHLKLSTGTGYEAKLNFVSEEESNGNVDRKSDVGNHTDIERLPQPLIRPCDISAELDKLERKIVEAPDESTGGKFFPSKYRQLISKRKSIFRVACSRTMDHSKLLTIPSPVMDSRVSQDRKKDTSVPQKEKRRMSSERSKTCESISGSGFTLNAIPKLTYPSISHIPASGNASDAVRPLSAFSLAAVSTVNNPVAVTRATMKISSKSEAEPIEEDNPSTDKARISPRFMNNCTVGSD